MMKLEENLRDSYEYTIKLFGNVGRLVLLIILNIIPIVNFIVMGYFARVIRESPRGVDPPPLERYGELWIDGAKIFVVMLAYMLVPIILMAIGAASMMAGILMPMTGLSSIGGMLIIVGVILSFLIMIIAIMAIAHMVKVGRLEGAFDFNTILSKIKAIGWGNYVLWIAVLFIIGLIIGGLSLIPYVGWLISLIISPIFMVFLGRSASNVYESAIIAPAPRPVAAQPSLFCGYCGNPIRPGDRFCGKCGKPVKHDISPT